MKSRLKYFMLNKALDFKRSFMENIEFDQEGIWVKEDSAENRGVFISRILDSQEAKMEWHRLVLKVEGENNAPYRITVYAADDLTRHSKGEPIHIKEVLNASDMNLETKQKWMKPFEQRVETSKKDILLHGISGRYLWFMIEMYRQADTVMKFESMKIYFPRQSWISYLPELYEGADKNTFLERYLAVFQSLYEDMKDAVREFPFRLDVESSSKDFLMWLAGWIDIADSYMWSQEQLRRLLTDGVYLYKIRGTRKGVLEFVKLYTGGEAYLVEYHQLEPFMKLEIQTKLLKQLYGNEPCTMFVVVKEKEVPTIREYKTLLRIIEEVKPAQMELKLIVVKPYIFLDGHSYMGINSVLGSFRPFALDGQALVSFTAIGSNCADINSESEER